jgi:FtsP/CotA-like multicopper oxidase with cupredoxin domain
MKEHARMDDTTGSQEARPDRHHPSISRRTLVRRSIAGTLAGGLALRSAAGLAHDATPAPSGTPHAGPAHGATPAATPVATGTPTPFSGTTGEPLREPTVRTSSDGVLETTLRAAVVPTTAGGRPVTAYAYEGEFPGPTLRLRPGDVLKVKLVNDLDACTNIHTHGFHVSPKDNSDNIFLMIDPGTSFDYEYQIPDNHPPGTFWYHPHCHGTTAVQTNGGMAGVIIIEGSLDDVEGIKGLTERTLALTATQFDGDGNVVHYDSQSAASLQRFVNGQLQPVIDIKPGETQRWRIANISADTFFLLALEAHTLYDIASDGNPYNQPVPQSQILLAPAERTEVLVQASTTPGNYQLRTLLWGPDYQSSPDELLATMVISGDAVDPSPIPETLIPFEDLRGLPVDNTRVTVFEEPGPPLYLAIDGKHFDPDRVDQTVKLGALEEWVVRNTSSHWHPFHIHVNDFQVISLNGEPVPAHGWQDTVALPPDSETIIRMRFDDFDGKFVYHCHILGHEDFGMMAVVEVVP